MTQITLKEFVNAAEVTVNSLLAAREELAALEAANVDPEKQQVLRQLISEIEPLFQCFRIV